MELLLGGLRGRKSLQESQARGGSSSSVRGQHPGEGAILGGMPLQEHTAWEQIVSWDGPSDGVCHWAPLYTGRERRAQDGALLAMSF